MYPNLDPPDLAPASQAPQVQLGGQIQPREMLTEMDPRNGQTSSLPTSSRVSSHNGTQSNSTVTCTKYIQNSQSIALFGELAILIAPEGDFPSESEKLLNQEKNGNGPLDRPTGRQPAD